MEKLKSVKINPNMTLIVVDVQNDFCPGGALPVPEGDQVVPVLNRYIQAFVSAGAPIFATRDWHPPHHCSFKPQGGPWPVHCIQGTAGVQFHPQLMLPKDAVLISKAANPQEDAYSGFEGTNLAQQLKDQGTQKILVGGLATDYCVKSTVLDGLKAGFKVYFLSDASRAVNVNPEDGPRAIREMLSAGAHTLTFNQLRLES